MIVENGLARVYLGVHWSFDAFLIRENGKPDLAARIGGVPLGLAVAEDLFRSELTKSPVGPR
jgi:vanadium chloroperoxidase